VGVSINLVLGADGEADIAELPLTAQRSPSGWRIEAQPAWSLPPRGVPAWGQLRAGAASRGTPVCLWKDCRRSRGGRPTAGPHPERGPSYPTLVDTTRLGGAPQVGTFSEQVWGLSTERHQPGRPVPAWILRTSPFGSSGKRSITSRRSLQRSW